jgi:glutamine synthetase
MKKNTKKLFEYVWLDANDNIRSKIKITTDNEAPFWNFDGSSTGQAIDSSISDIILNPVRTYNNPFFKINNVNSYIVLCECLNPNMTPHISNHRSKCSNMSIKYNEFDCLFGIEQEYVIFENNPYFESIKWYIDLNENRSKNKTHNIQFHSYTIRPNGGGTRKINKHRGNKNNNIPMRTYIQPYIPDVLSWNYIDFIRNK